MMYNDAVSVVEERVVLQAWLLIDSGKQGPRLEEVVAYWTDQKG